MDNPIKMDDLGYPYFRNPPNAFSLSVSLGGIVYNSGQSIILTHPRDNHSNGLDQEQGLSEYRVPKKSDG